MQAEKKKTVEEYTSRGRERTEPGPVTKHLNSPRKEGSPTTGLTTFKKLLGSRPEGGMSFCCCIFDNNEGRKKQTPRVLSSQSAVRRQNRKSDDSIGFQSLPLPASTPSICTTFASVRHSQLRVSGSDACARFRWTAPGLVRIRRFWSAGFPRPDFILQTPQSASLCL